MAEHIQLQAQVPESMDSERFDQIAAKLFPEYSRSRLQAWIKSGDLVVNDEVRRTRDKLSSGDSLTVSVSVEDSDQWQPESIPLSIVYEDESLLVLNKPAGLVVHPAAGHAKGTLVNALLSHCPDLAALPRAGIVHRLDKDTTGLMVVAKTLAAHTHLVMQLQAREVSREYEAVVQGVMTGGGVVDVPIGRHPKQRIKMAVVENGGKEAVTHYRILKRYRAHTHIRVQLETGRTHQIRVHMAHQRYPLVGDPVYGGRLQLPKGVTSEMREMLKRFRRQALHAQRLSLVHPDTEDIMEWECDLPDDFQQLLAVLEQDVNASE